MTQIIPLKMGLFGGQGSGKTTTAALIAAALSKELHNGAPVWVTDTEPAWQFVRPRIFVPEKIELVTRKIPTFKAMLQDMYEAEKAGACVWAACSPSSHPGRQYRRSTRISEEYSQTGRVTTRPLSTY